MAIANDSLWSRRESGESLTLEVTGLTFSWGSGEKASDRLDGANGKRLQIVRDFDMTVRPGEVTALVGPSGVGKTTLLRLLGGLIEPDGGAVVTPERASPGVAFVFQEPRLLPWRTVAENVALSRGGNGTLREGRSSLKRRDNVVVPALRRVHLETETNRYPDELSGGMQQRVGLARALSAHPDLLLIDEPLSGIDQAHRGELSEYLRSIITASGVTTVISSHDLPFVYAVADRILLLEERPARIVLDRRREATGWTPETAREIEERLTESRHTV